MTCCGADGMAGEIARQAGSDAHTGIAEEQLRHAAHWRDDGLLQSDFIVPDMHCAACLAKIESRLLALPFVDNARANLSTRRVSVFWRGNEGNAETLSEALAQAGYPNTPFDLGALTGDEGEITTRNLLLALAVAGFAAANIMLLSVSVWSGADAETAQLFHLISGLIAIPAVAYAGQPFFRSAATALKSRSLNMDVPISLAVLLALFMSIYESLTGGESAYFDASVTLLFFLLIGRTLDHMMREKARGAVTRLSRFASRGAGLIGADGSVRFVPLGEIETGMRLLVTAGERFPVDATVASGRSDTDRSLVTGESAPVAIKPGDTIEAGTLNLTGAVEIIAEKPADKSFLSEIIQMMEAAEKGKARYVRIADRMAAIYAPVVHILAAVTLVAWMFYSGDWHMAVYAAISVLIITCPCALGLAVPVVHVVAANRLFGEGVMVKDGAAFEKLAAVTRVIFDKTGTLTLGRPEVTGISGLAENDAAAIRALALRSRHPSAEAIARYYSDRPAHEATDVNEYPGYGVEARVDGRRARLGRIEWVAEIANAATEATDREKHSAAFAFADGPMSSFGLEDALRPDAAAVIGRLQAAGLEPEILSGDRSHAVATIAGRLGIERYSAELAPQQKIARIEALQENGQKVLMVGDGINDAPALAMGHVSMAPASASDVGRLAADLVFTRDSLAAIPFALGVARKSGRLVTGNFAIAIAYNCVAVPLAMAGFVTPLIAAIAMSASSIVVVANSMRLGIGSVADSGSKRDHGGQADESHRTNTIAGRQAVA